MNKLCNINNSKIEKINNRKNKSFIFKILEKILDIFKITNIGTIKIKNKEYVIKKEYFKDNFYILNFIYNLLDFNVNEYNFYKKFNNKIIKNHFDKNIQLPVKYKICNKFYVYLFSKIDYDLNYNFLKKINNSTFINILKQVVFIVYFLNHKLNVFHNDLVLINQMRNIMINENKIKYKLTLDNNTLEVNKYRVVFIDFGLFSKDFKFKNREFYLKKSVKYFTTFEIMSELLIIIFLLLKNYYKNKDIDFKKLYYYFYNNIKVKNLKNFDKYIFNNINNINKIVNLIE
jgi:hypothetical protein